MQRLRVYDLRNSRLPSVIGKCQDDVPGICSWINSAQERLISCRESQDEGWWGTWAEVVFNVSRTTPYITLPREIARLEMVDLCDQPIAVQNQFYEYLRFGNGRLPKLWPRCRCEIQQAFTRNNAITFTEMTGIPQYLVAYLTDDRDVGKRVLFQGLDSNDNTIYSTDVTEQVTGVFVTLETLPSLTAMTFNQIQGIQKDITVGPVRIYQHDPATGEEILLLTMQPTEQTAMYRRYYLSALPCNCCGADDTTTVQVTAIAKLDLIPVMTDTDYTLIQSREAIINECQSIRMSEMDNPNSQKMAIKFHADAVGALNGQLNHYLGKNAPAINFAPFGSAHLRRQAIGTLW